MVVLNCPLFGLSHCFSWAINEDITLESIDVEVNGGWAAG